MKNKLGVFGAILLIIFGILMLNISRDVFSGGGFNFEFVILFFYGTVPLGLAIYIIFNLDKEDKIEQIKSKKN